MLQAETAGAWILMQMPKFIWLKQLNAVTNEQNRSLAEH